MLGIQWSMGLGRIQLEVGEVAGKDSMVPRGAIGRKKAANQRLDLATNMVRGDAKREKHGFEHR